MKKTIKAWAVIEPLEEVPEDDLMFYSPGDTDFIPYAIFCQTDREEANRWAIKAESTEGKAKVIPCTITYTL